jgi:acyl-CoA reductase-like NAD-dependent aldehyde dehydrogenase
VPCGIIGAALFAGSTVVLKPCERTPHTGLRLAHLLATGLPPVVLEVVIDDGSAGAVLAESA